MKRSEKLWIAAAWMLLAVGAVMFTSVMCSRQWNLANLSTVRYVSNTHEIAGEFRGVSVTTESADVEFVPTEDGTCRVECREEEKALHSVAVENGTLVVRLDDERTWRNYVGVRFDESRITVYLPAGAYGALSVRGTTGSVTVPDGLTFESADVELKTGNVAFGAPAEGAVRIQTTTGNIQVTAARAASLSLSATTGNVSAAGLECAGSVEADVTTGRMELRDVSCGSVRTAGTTGNLLLKRVIAAESVSVERTTGNVEFNKADAPEIEVKTTTGDVNGTLLSGKRFYTETKTGFMSMPMESSGGTFRVTTTTGSARITVAK